MTIIRKLRWIVAAAVGAVGLAAVPAQAQAADISLGVTLGGPAYYYAPPPPRYYERTVVYEEPVYYAPRTRVVYESHYCPRHHVYHRSPRGHARVHYRHEHRDWHD